MVGAQKCPSTSEIAKPPSSDDDDSTQEFLALDGAKAAAQADYERRILSALAHPVQPGWRK